MQWKTPSFPRPKNPSMTKSQTKTMLILFFDIRSIVHLEFILQGQVVSQAAYIEILTILHVAVLRKRLNLGATIGSSFKTTFQLTKHCVSATLQQHDLLLDWNIPRIHQISLPVNFGSLQNYNPS
jgi:hypothetical protein